jgi:phospholipid-binding lipoprotein MlaA
MSISTFIIALPLVGTQPDPGSLPPLAPDPPAIEQQNVPAPAVPAETDDRPVADLQPENPENPTPPTEPAGPDDAIVVTARPGAPPGDPLQALNVQSFSVVQSVDEAVTGPVALTYRRAVPAPVRSGLRNFLSNLQEPIVSLNYLLQLKPGKSAETLGRFAINSTIGGAGLFDVAKRSPFKLQHRTNGFAYTLGYYGVKPGPYMYLPLMGPTTVRDLAGRIVDLSVLPVAVGQPFSEPLFVIPTTVIRLIDERAEADDEIRELRDGATDPYSTVREDYLRERQAEIDALRGKHHDRDRSSSKSATPGDSDIAPPRRR